MRNVNLTCTKCPMGCKLTLTIDGDNIKIEGNNCKIGEKYGISEYSNPVRTITTSVKVKTTDGIKMISVKSSSDVPKGKVFECIKEVKKLHIEKDEINVGDVLIKNILGLDADIVATKSLNI